MFNVNLRHPFTMLVIGPSGSGKTTWIFNLLLEKSLLFSKSPARIIFFYKHWQSLYEDMLEQRIVDRFIQGIPPLEKIRELITPYKDTDGSLLIFDDALQDANEASEQLFTEISHHYNASIVWLSQKLFLENSQYRSMSLNAKYIVLLKNARDSRQIVVFASQIRPYRSSAVVDAFTKATTPAYGYMLFDFDQAQSDSVRMRSSIFTHEHPMTTYVLNS